MLKSLTVVSVIGLAMMTAVGAGAEASSPKSEAMIFTPSSGDMWDPSVIWHDGQYHLFAMMKPRGVVIQPERQTEWPGYYGMLYATSKDGVHWQDQGSVLTPTRADKRVLKMFVGRCGDRFIMDHGAYGPFSQVGGLYNDTLGFYESKDLRNWTYIGENHPDPKYYETKGRWDHMYMLPKEEGNPAAGFWGYVVAAPNEAMCNEGRGFGMMESPDGRKWTPLPPPKVDCGRFPPIHALEIGGCERLAGKYYLIGGGVAPEFGQLNYSMFALVADSPTGPFKLDQDAWRLCGGSGYPGRMGVQWLASFCRGNGEILFSQYISGEKGVWLVPLKKAVVDSAGHLRMGYWKNNDAAKGAGIALNAAACRLAYPPVPGSNTPVPAGVEAAAGQVKLIPEHPKNEDSRDRQALALFDTKFDPRRGVILEGTIKAEPVGRPRPQYAGFYIEEANGKGLPILLQVGHPTWRRSLIGNLSLAPKWSFECLDETGPGCATVTGLDWNRPHSFRLWLRNNALELYIDDILMQTFITTSMTGRLGIVAQNLPATFGDLKMWQMNLAE
jgi:hypothetical protein